MILDSISENLCAKVYNNLGALYRRKGPKYAKQSQKYLEKALLIYEKHDDKRNVVEVLSLLTDGSVWPSIPPSIEEPNPEKKCSNACEKALLIAEELQDTQLKIQWLARLGSYKDFLYQEQLVLQAFELWKKSDNPDKPHGILESVRGIYAGYAKYKTGMKYLNEALEFANRKGNLMWESWIIYLVGRSLGVYITLQKESLSTLERSLAIRERVGYRKSSILSTIGPMWLTQGKWKNAEEYFQKAMSDSGSGNRYNLWRLYMSKGDYKHVEKEFLHSLEQSEKYKRSPSILTYAWGALNYVLLGEKKQSKKYIEQIYIRLEEKIMPIIKWQSLYITSETHRLLGELEAAKTACQKSLEGFLINADDPEDLIDVAEARLNMGKILVDMGDFQEAITYLEQAQTAFAVCQHYALGETLLYLGKAHLGLGGVILRRQAKDYVVKALAEFQRLELRHKEQEAQEVLHAL